jgi:hypothetical protein
MAFLVTATMESTSGIPADRVVNTFAVAGGDAASATSRDGVLAAFENFYADVPTGATQAAGWWLGKQLSRGAGAGRLRLYDITNDLAGTPHGSPIGELPFTLDTPGDDESYPDEVAICVTIEGLNRLAAPVEGAGDTRPRQRRTGRIFFGPLSKVSAGNTLTRPTVSSGVTTWLGQAFDKLQTDLIALGAGEALGVWSRANATVLTAEAVSVDNAFDTQRRRGLKASSRSRFVIP